MLTALLIWFYTLALCYIYGFLFLKLLQRFFDIKNEFPNFSLVVVVGLVTLTGIASFASLFINIGLIVNLLLIAGAGTALLTGYVSLPRFERPANFGALILLLVALLVVLENATHRPLNPDTDIYHAQAIRWIETYPVVPGLGNLHGRLAFNSAWFITNALFSFSFLAGRSFHLSASVLFLAILFYSWRSFLDLGQGKYSLAALVKMAFFPLAFMLLGAEVSSPGSDFPASLLVWLVFVLWLEYIQTEKPYYPEIIFLLTIFALTVKLSTLPIALLAFFELGETILHWDNRRFWGQVAIGAFIFLPFVARNVILSGYVLYPFPAIDIFSFDWKVPFARVAQERAAILAWGRLPCMDAAQVLSMPFRQWFPRWLTEQTLNRKSMLFTALLSPFAMVPALVANIAPRRAWLAWLLAYIGVLFWLFSVPDFRFGYGFLIPAILLAVAPFLALVLPRVRVTNVVVSGIVLGLMLIFISFTLIRSVETRSFIERLILPADYDHVPTQPCDLANGTVFCAKAYNACSYEVFPCIPSPRSKVELRGVEFFDGFRTVP